MYKKLLVSALPLLVLVCAGVVSAQMNCNGGLCNPLKSAISSIPQLIAAFLKAVVMVALPILSLAFVWTGFLFVSARGSTDKLNTAKRAFFYTVIGAILILGAWLIANLIGTTVSQLLPNA